MQMKGDWHQETKGSLRVEHLRQRTSEWLEVVDDLLRWSMIC